MSRRLGLIRGSRLLFGAAVIAIVGKPSTANATKADKRDFSYQERPKDGKSCATCRLYSIGPSGKGACAIVDGDVSPSGWCMAYSPRG
ncbi:MAG: high-potential iron-sulfur protein [Caldimonas sp.]